MSPMTDGRVLIIITCFWSCKFGEQIYLINNTIYLNKDQPVSGIDNLI